MKRFCYLLVITLITGYLVPVAGFAAEQSVETSTGTPVEDEPVSIWVEINPNDIGKTSGCATTWVFTLSGAMPGVDPLFTVSFKEAGEVVRQSTGHEGESYSLSVSLNGPDKLLGARVNVLLPRRIDGIKLDLNPLEKPPLPPKPPVVKPKPPVVKPETPVIKPKPAVVKSETPVIPKPVVYVRPPGRPPVENEEYLPYTGSESLLLLGLAGVFTLVVMYLRRLGRKEDLIHNR